MAVPVDTPGTQPAKPEVRSRSTRRLASIALLLCLIIAYFYWPRSAPSYVPLPDGHGRVKVESWLCMSWSVDREYYIKTEVPRKLEEVLDDLTKYVPEGQRVSRASRNKWDEEHPVQGCVFDEVNGTNVLRISGVDAARRFGWPPGLGFPSGGYGRAMPPAFVKLAVKPPPDDSSRAHMIFYRLSELPSGGQTLVEVWDVKFTPLRD
jgi:hypothetical protein